MIPNVKTCTVDQCYYNQNNLCHANAITVGSSCPMCDTFIASQQHGTPAEKGLVGACHESDCRFNQMLSCQAEGIDVGFHGQHADCLTYSPKM